MTVRWKIQDPEAAEDSHGPAGRQLEALARLAETGSVDALDALVARDDEVGIVARALLDYHESRRQINGEELRHRRIIEGSLDPVVTVDGRGRIIEFNSAAETVFEVKRESVILQPVATLINAEILRDAQRRSFQKFIAAGAPTERGHKVEASGRRPDGSSFPIEIGVTVLQERTGPVFCASIRDISDRGEVELAREESEAKTRFLATISHELRTPLNSVLGFTQLLEAETFGGLNDKQKRYVRHIRSSGSHLLRLIGEVLDLAKVQAGQLTVSMEEFPFEPLAREVIEELEPIAQAGGLELCLEVPSAATAWSDRMRLRQVLLNLISNAIKFTPSGGRAWLRASSGPDGLHIEVSDTGVGMAANQLQRIFDEFVQIEEGTTRRHDGTGLGLALSRRLADLMGGRLTVTSSVGQGSTFRLALPAVPVG